MESGNEKGLQRRDVLKAGLLAMGAAILPAAAGAAPAPSGGDMLERMRDEYGRRVERLAEELRPRFESGEFRGYRSGDEDSYPRYRDSPRWRFEKLLETREITSTAAAYLVLACSPSESITDDGELYDVRNIAAEAMALDVYRVGLRDGWYAPEDGEEPSAAKLLGLFDDAAEDA